jgi:hypothetical protein
MLMMRREKRKWSKIYLEGDNFPVNFKIIDPVP